MRIVFGTKGGRPRDTTVNRHDELIGRLLSAIAHSAEHIGKMVDKAGLRSVIERYLNMTGNT
ncbi:integrase domain-containing protein [Pantoea dispersa]|uniref:integrase domain-containing protein n=1 Tax=Pantoea dispersa TaxID=59814 RepID=UPI0023EC0CF2|nr:integrase domain-containing protein [Pantoea dispersa]